MTVFEQAVLLELQSMRKALEHIAVELHLASPRPHLSHCPKQASNPASATACCTCGIGDRS